MFLEFIFPASVGLFILGTGWAVEDRLPHALVALVLSGIGVTYTLLYLINETVKGFSHG